MKKIGLLVTFIVVLSLVFTACGSSAPTTAPETEADAPAEEPVAEEPAAEEPVAEIPDVNLTLWGSEIPEFQAAFRVMADEFIAMYADEANITIEIGAQSESTVYDTLATDVSAGADVYYGADDRVASLVEIGALQAVENADAIIEANGGANAGAVLASTVDGTLYAYPAMAGNGYFLYYNTDYVTPEQADSWAGLLAAANAAGKQVTMQLNSGWYLYSFFAGGGLGCSLADDGVTTVCDWNQAGGPDVAQAIIDIATDPGFIHLDDAGFVTAV
ncbi:MAG: extracellular solute-binding protein [Anaerolineales bacterium]|nr:extracellular solute-binding protein [Anaerolineales bacterium]